MFQFISEGIWNTARTCVSKVNLTPQKRKSPTCSNFEIFGHQSLHQILKHIRIVDNFWVYKYISIYSWRMKKIEGYFWYPVHPSIPSHPSVNKHFQDFVKANYGCWNEASKNPSLDHNRMERLFNGPPSKLEFCQKVRHDFMFQFSFSQKLRHDF